MTRTGRSPYDVAVIGGGPAGSSCAITLARAGRSVVLFERDVLPRHKLCGEFLSGDARVHLAGLGCLDAVEGAAPATIRHARVVLPSGRVTTVALPTPAWGVSRSVLDHVLLSRAQAEGVHVHTGVTVTAVEAGRTGVHLASRTPRAPTRAVSAGLVVGAWGRHTVLDRQLGRAFTSRQHPWTGLKRHHRIRPGWEGQARSLDDHVEIHAVEGGYCGITLVEEGLVTVCLLVERSRIRRGEKPSWATLLQDLGRRHPTLAARMAGLEADGSGVHAVSEIPFVNKNLAQGRVLFVGDAGGVIAPVCGDGQAMALEGGVGLGELIATLPRPATDLEVASVGRRWQRDWTRRFRTRLTVGRLVQRALLRECIAEPVLVSLGLCPPVGRWLARVTRSRTARQGTSRTAVSSSPV